MHIWCITPGRSDGQEVTYEKGSLQITFSLAQLLVNGIILGSDEKRLLWVTII